MAINPIQFQKGLSVTHFLADYGTEEQCEAALLKARWPQGFRCPACGSDAVLRIPANVTAHSGERDRCA